MKTILGILAVLLILVLAAIFSRDVLKKNIFPQFNHSSSANLAIKNQNFSLLVAKTESDKQIGLSKKNSLPNNQGMVFLFDQPGYYAFWMHGMKFPLDILFLKNKQVVTVFENVHNPSFPNSNLPIFKPDAPADMVLELNAGTTSKYGIRRGDMLNITL